MAEPGEGAFLEGLRATLTDPLANADLFNPEHGYLGPTDLRLGLPDEITGALDSVEAKLTELAGETVAKIITGVLAGIIKTLELSGQASGLILGIIQANMELGRQSAYNVIQPVPLDPTTLIPLVFRAQLNFDSWIEEIKNNGVSADRGASLLAANQPILTAEQVLTLRQRQALSSDEARERLGQLGYDSPPITELLRLVPQLVDANSHLAMWLRKEIDESELNTRLAELGLEDRERETLRTLAFFIPPVQDLVRFAVREAFEPELAASLGFTEGLPPEFVEAAALQGVSKDWAEKYWISHWVFPSTGQVLEMFQRDIITLEQVKEAFKALDIAPLWQQRLIDIGFLPMGRIDIRRARRLGVLSFDDMVTRYRHTGYSPEDAKILSDFTELDINDSLIGQGEARITTLFREGFLTESEFRDFLDRLGRTDEQIELLVSTQLLIREADHVKDLTNALRSQFNKRRISEVEAAAQLALFGVPPENISRLLREWIETREARRSILGIADIRKARKKGILDDKEFREILVEKGFGERDIQIMFELNPAVETEEGEPPLTPEQVAAVEETAEGLTMSDENP